MRFIEFYYIHRNISIHNVSKLWHIVACIYELITSNPSKKHNDFKEILSYTIRKNIFPFSNLWLILTVLVQNHFSMICIFCFFSKYLLLDGKPRQISDYLYGNVSLTEFLF